MSLWAIDLGTTNSAVARWNNQGDYPEMIHLPGVCRNPLEHQEIEVRYSVPSSLYLLPQKGLSGWLNQSPFWERLVFLGQKALIGRAAIDKDNSAFSPFYIDSFKPYLMRDSFWPLARAYKKSYTARQIGQIYLRELLREIQQTSGERPRNITFSVPVDSYEIYRAELKKLSRSLGVHRFKVIDEPVAAALGYGLSADEEQNVLVIDFGGGTLDLALISLKECFSEMGRCQVVAKSGAPLGGNVVDAWLVDHFCSSLAYELHRGSDHGNSKWWYQVMLAEARRVKESLFFKKTATFYLTPPSEMQNFEARVYARNNELDRPLDISRAELVEILDKKGLYDELGKQIETVLEQAARKGIGQNDIHEVLMVGGSTLLPEIYKEVEQLFGRQKVRAWQPFEAVAHGACAFGAGKLRKADFITHDYAFITYNRKTHEPEYNVIVPRGTAFPTPKDFWKHHLTPTCPLGLPEGIFKLVICEIGKRHEFDQEFIWDTDGQLHSLKKGDKEKQLVIPLNENEPALGVLNPPHHPSDRTARLEVSFMVNEERWLCATVLDMKTGGLLMNKSPLYRLK